MAGPSSSTESSTTDTTGTSDLILDAVVSVIVRDGIDGTSMRQVAREADVSLGLISYHFDDKQTLITAAFQRLADQLLDRARGGMAAATSPSEKLQVFLDTAFHSEYLAAPYLSMRIALWAVSRNHPDIAQVEHDLHIRYTAELGALISDVVPGLGAHQAKQRAIDVATLQNGLWLHWARYQNQDDLARGIERCREIAFGAAG